MDVDLIVSEELEDDSSLFDDQSNDLSNLEGERCGICMDVIIDRGVLDCCQHWFCFACIDNWATITNLCPLCQSEFQLITCVPLYDTIGSNKVDEDSFPRDEDWSIEGKSNNLSFPSYYIDENAVICLDGDGCKIRSQSLNVVGDDSIDTSIACDSCDIWYHAFCVGFDTESTSEDTWLCPRCIANELPQKSDEFPMEQTSEQHSPGNPNIECSTETSLSGKLTLSVVDDGTAIIVSMVGGKQPKEEPIEFFSSTPEPWEGLKPQTSNLDAACPNLEIPSNENINLQSILTGGELKSLSCDNVSTLPTNSLVLDELKPCTVEEAVKDPASLVGLVKSLQKPSVESYSANQVPESEPSTGLHFDSSLSGENIAPDDNAGKVIGVKRKLTSSRADLSEGEDTKNNNKSENYKRKRRDGESVQLASKNQRNAAISDDNSKFSALKAVSRDSDVRNLSKKEHVASDIMSIVKGTTGRTSLKRPAQSSAANESSKEAENASGLRVKKIMRTSSEDKESSILVQNLRKEIREVVGNKSSKEVGERLFDPQLLAAFRAAIAGPNPEHVKKSSPFNAKMKKAILQKGKVRENLTKKIYGDSSGRRKHAWVRDCEVEFWKHRCMSGSKPEKIETLKSVLDLLKKHPESLEKEPESECQPSNPILSRLYLADTSVFPRKDDIKPLSSLDTAGTSEQNEQLSSPAKTLKPSLETTKVGAPSADINGTKTLVSNSKGDAASSKVHSSRGSDGSSNSKPSGSKNAKSKEVVSKAVDVKFDKRKLALQVLARKKAAESRNGTHENQEENAALKGNYPLLAQLPADMRPNLAASRHNKIPIAVRQTQLYRLTELLLRRANLPVIRRTAETELAVADAINIEKSVADRSNSKLVYMNLCSQEILHRSDDSKFGRTKEESTSTPSEAPIDRQEQGSGECSTDPSVEEALRAAGLLSDSPPNSPRHKTEGDGSSLKVEEEPDNIFDMDSHLEMDIYGDFEYDIEDEDYIGMNAKKIQRLQPEGDAPKVKVVFSTIASESANNVEDQGRLGSVENEADAANASLTVEDGTNKTCDSLESLPGEDEELSLAECEELYGPDKEPIIIKLPEASQKLHGIADAEAPAITENNKSAATNQTANAGTVDANVGQKEEKKTPSTKIDKRGDAANPVIKKVEAYIKEHIRPLCKSGVITIEQYQWAVAKTTDKVMKFHVNAKNASFLIKEGEKVKKLAEQYVEAAPQDSANFVGRVGDSESS